MMFDVRVTYPGLASGVSRTIEFIFTNHSPKHGHQVSPESTPTKTIEEEVQYIIADGKDVRDFLRNLFLIRFS